MSSVSPAKDPFILELRQPANGRVHTLQGVVTLIAWIAYAWLWLPVVTVIAWLLGVRTSFVELQLRNYEFDQDTFGILLMLAIGTTVLMIGWAEYNRHKFGGPDRRTQAENVRQEAIAQVLGGSADVAGPLSRAKSITLAMGEDARPTGVHHHTPMAGLLK